MGWLLVELAGRDQEGWTRKARKKEMDGTGVGQQVVEKTE
jgi:hypothetical protein